MLLKTLASSLLLSLILSVTAVPTGCVSKPDECPVETVALECTTQEFVDAGSHGTPLYKMSFSAAREFLENVQAKDNPSLSTIDYSEHNLPIGPTGNVNLHIYRPKGLEDKTLPVIFYFHGGGWILGSPNTHRRLMFDLLKETNSAILFVNYTRSPEAQFPIPVEQAWSAVEWLQSNGKKLNLDASRVAFAGDSAGGAMAAAVNLISIQKNAMELLPRFQVLFYPVTDISKESCTYKTFAKGPGLTPDTLRWMIGEYTHDAQARTDILASPLLASTELLRYMPETMIITAQVDPLRQEGEDFAHRLVESGVQVTMMRALGTIHDFVMLNPLANTTATRVAIRTAGGSLREALMA
ncbi:putative lipase protein [Pyronema omphalodes]|nr:putative lipase protein [Pyronema omphalodes]